MAPRGKFCINHRYKFCSTMCQEVVDPSSQPLSEGLTMTAFSLRPDSEVSNSTCAGASARSFLG